MKYIINGYSFQTIEGIENVFILHINEEIEKDAGTEVPERFFGTIKSDYYTRYYQNSLLNRDEDLPAIIYADGSKEYYKDGLCHRENNLPAIERVIGIGYKNSQVEFYKNGNYYMNKEFGLPYINYADGTKKFFYDDWYICENPDGTKKKYTLVYKG
jgi:hypothetical protein